MPLFIPLVCLLGMGIATLRRPAAVALEDPAERDDVPARLLRWAAGLLPAQREEWGQAMLGELASIQGRGRRSRFAAGCAVAALLLPPRGRAAAAVMAAAAGIAALYARVGIRYGLGAGDWAWAAVALVLLASYAIGAGVLLRRPGIAIPGLAGGLLLALAWLAASGFTFSGVIAALWAAWMLPVLLLLVPGLLGASATLWGGSAAAGARIARLAALSAGLGVFGYATVAVAALGAGGPTGDPRWSVSAVVADRLGNNIVFDLWFLPLTTAAIAWSAATATARVHPGLATTAAPLPPAADGPAHLGIPSPVTVTPPHEAEQSARSRSQLQAARLLLLSAIAAAIVIVAAAIFLKG